MTAPPERRATETASPRLRWAVDAPLAPDDRAVNVAAFWRPPAEVRRIAAGVLAPGGSLHVLAQSPGRRDAADMRAFADVVAGRLRESGRVAEEVMLEGDGAGCSACVVGRLPARPER